MDRATKILRIIKCSPRSMALKKSQLTCEDGTSRGVLRELNEKRLANSNPDASKENINSEINDENSIAHPAKKKKIERKSLITLEQLEKEAKKKKLGDQFEVFCDIGPTITELDRGPNGRNVDPKSVIDFARNKIMALKNERIVARKANNIALARKLSKSVQMYRNIIEEIFDRKPSFIAVEAEFYSSDSDSSSSSEKAKSLEDLTSSDTMEARNDKSHDNLAEPLIPEDTDNMELRNDKSCNSVIEPDASVLKDSDTMESRHNKSCNSMTEPCASVLTDTMESRNDENHDNLAESLAHEDTDNMESRSDKSCNSVIEPDASDLKGNDRVRKKLKFDSVSNELVTAPATINETSHPSSMDDLIKEMESTCKELKKQKCEALRIGKCSTARRKNKLLKQYMQAIDKLKKGEQVDTDTLPKLTPMKSSDYENNHEDELVTSRLSDNDDTIADVIEEENRVDCINTLGVKDKTKRIGKKLNYCMFCSKLVKEYCVHIEKHHPNTPEGMELSKINVEDSRLRGKLKREITDRLRKKANDIYNKQVLKEKEIGLSVKELIPVKERHSSKMTKQNTSVCKHCFGYYKTDRMTIHLKLCKALNQDQDSDKTNNLTKKKNIKNHAIPVLLLSNIVGATEEFKNSILSKMNCDRTKEEALRDPLIMKFGSEFFKSRRSEEHAHYVSSKVRDLSNLVIEMKKLDPYVRNLEDCMNPARFDILVKAVLNLSRYDPQSGQLEVPSVAYRMSQPLKIAAIIAKSDAVREAYKGETVDLSKANKFQHFLDEVKNQWAISIGRISSNIRKGAAANKLQIFALAEDIVKVCSYVESKYRKEMRILESSSDKCQPYDSLMEMLICHIMCLIRRRPVDFKRATCLHYSLLDKQDDLIDMVKQCNESNSETNFESIKQIEIENCRKFHIFYVPGKNLEIVPIVLTPLMKEVLDCLLNFRKSVGIGDVDPKKDKLFLLSGGKIVNPVICLRQIKTKVKLKQPSTFTNNGLRHQAATFSKLHSNHPQYQDFLASMLGHTLMIHKKHYELPTSILQKMVVCPILHEITLGKISKRNGPEQGRKTPCEQVTHHDKVVDEENEEYNNNSTRNNIVKRMTTSTVTHHEVIDEENEEYNNTNETVEYNGENLKKIQNVKHVGTTSSDFSSSESEYESPKKKGQDKKIRRYCEKKRKWTTAEKLFICNYFGKRLLNRDIPRRSEVMKMYQTNRIIFDERSFDSVYVYVNNLANRKQNNVSPMIKRCLNQS